MPQECSGVFPQTVRWPWKGDRLPQLTATSSTHVIFTPMAQPNPCGYQGQGVRSLVTHPPDASLKDFLVSRLAKGSVKSSRKLRSVVSFPRNPQLSTGIGFRCLSESPSGFSPHQLPETTSNLSWHLGDTSSIAEPLMVMVRKISPAQTFRRHALSEWVLFTCPWLLPHNLHCSFF